MKRAKNNLATLKRLFLLLLLICFLAVIFIIISKRRVAVIKEIAQEESFPAIKVTLLNGCGYDGVAKRVREKLNPQNIDIISCSNAEKFIYNKSIIVVKKKDEIDLKRLQRITGIKRRIYALNENSHASFYIIIGKDFKKYFNDQ